MIRQVGDGRTPSPKAKINTAGARVCRSAHLNRTICERTSKTRLLGRGPRPRRWDQASHRFRLSGHRCRCAARRRVRTPETAVVRLISQRQQIANADAPLPTLGRWRSLRSRAACLRMTQVAIVDYPGGAPGLSDRTVTRGGKHGRSQAGHCY
jgi:hypothetical protein